MPNTESLGGQGAGREPGPRDYSAGTRAGLVALSQGRCYYPDCEEPLVKRVGDAVVIAYEIAHIRDAGPGNRHVAEMTNDERRSFPNLVLLCPPHHKMVDKIRPADFSIEDMERWKRAADPSGAGDLSALTESALEEALMSVTVHVAADVVHLGGAGGGPGGGGGGGAGLFGGTGGPGGPGGAITVNDATRIEADGQPGQWPGGGGGGGGLLAPGSIIRNAVPPTPGEGHSVGVDAADGGDTTIGDQEGNVLLRAAGGRGGVAGTRIRSTSELIRVPTLLLANSWDVRDGLLYLLGAGWDTLHIANLGDPVALPVAIVFACAGVEPGEYTITLRATGPAGAEHTVTFPLVVATKGDILNISRIARLDFALPAFGLWTLAAEHGSRTLAALDVNIKRVGEA